MSETSKLLTVNQIVAVGSVDGILTTAALLSIIGPAKEVYVQFTTAATVNDLTIGLWRPARQIALVNLGVNFSDLFITRMFIDRLYRGGHKIVAVIDEHGRELWQAVLAPYCCLSDLAVEPQTQAVNSNIRSSGAVLLNTLGVQATEHQRTLLLAAESADRGNFSPPLASLVNRSIKPDLYNQRRRVYLARHLAATAEPDATIQRWMTEYLPLQRRAQDIWHARSNLGEGIVSLVLDSRPVDMTDLIVRVWIAGARVVVLSHQQQDNDQRLVPTVIRTRYVWLDLPRIVAHAGLDVIGNSSRLRVTVRPQDETRAIEAIRHAIIRHELSVEAANQANLAPVVVQQPEMALAE